MKALKLLCVLLLLSGAALAQSSSCIAITTTPIGTQLASGLTATTYIDTAPVDGATYQYTITAVDAWGYACSNLTAQQTIPPTGTHTVTLTWTASTTAGVTYSVWRGSPPQGPTNATATVD